MLIVVSTFFVVGCANVNSNVNTANDYLRIHIRANSNSMDDQNIKYLVKDSIIKYLSPIIADCTTKQMMLNAVNNNLNNIEEVANSVLNSNGYMYKSNAYINKEYFPTKTYGNYTLEADMYDAIIVELGEAQGNNWWCVVYPPLCFVNATETSTAGFKYKSKLVEIINKFFN